MQPTSTHRQPWSVHRFASSEWIALALMFGVEAGVVAACLAVSSAAIATAIFTALLVVGTVLFVGCVAQSIRAANNARPVSQLSQTTVRPAASR